MLDRMELHAFVFDGEDTVGDHCLFSLCMSRMTHMSSSQRLCFLRAHACT